MTTLDRLQHGFKRYLFDGDHRIAASVVDGGGLDAHARLQIYDNAYRARLAEVLSGDYPATRAVLGDAPFAELSAAYIRAYPSDSFTLRGFGARLPWFLESQTDSPNGEFVVELATFEWAFVEAFDAPDRAAATLEDIARISPDGWPGLSIDVQPSVQVVDTRFNTRSIWSAVKARDDLPAADALAVPAGCFVWRQGLTTVFRSAEPDELIAWRVLASGDDLSAMCEALLDRLTPEEIPPRAASLLRIWLNDGLIGRLRAS